MSGTVSVALTDVLASSQKLRRALASSTRQGRIAGVAEGRDTLGLQGLVAWKGNNSGGWDRTSDLGLMKTLL